MLVEFSQLAFYALGCQIERLIASAWLAVGAFSISSIGVGSGAL